MLSVALVVFVGWIASVCLHEFGHAIVAYWGGDTSVKEKGYLTLNPLKYTNVTLSLVLPLIFLLIGGIPLPGAAVYIDQSRLRNRAWKSAVSLAGPAASGLVALGLSLPFLFGVAPTFSEPLWYDESAWLWYALAFLALLQVAGMVLNLLPIPSLDGYGAIEPWLPEPWQVRFNQWRKYGILILFGALWLMPSVNRAFWDLVNGISHVLRIPHDAAWVGHELFNQWAAPLLMAMIAVVFLGQRLAPKPPQYWPQQGHQLRQQQQYERAIAAYDQGIRANPQDYSSWMGRGHVLRDLGQYAEAVEAYRQTIEVQPQEYTAWYLRGLALAYLHRHEEAIAAYSQALKLHPDYPELYCLRAQALRHLGRPEEARADYQTVLTQNPEHQLALTEQASMLRDEQRYGEAIALYDHLLARIPQDSFTWLNRGLALRGLHRYEEELDAYNHALQGCPEDAYLWGLKGVVLRDLKRYDEAEVALARAIFQQPDWGEAWQQRGQILQLLGQQERALTAFDQALKLQPERADIWIDRGLVLMGVYRYEEAIASFEYAISDSAWCPVARYNQGCCYALQHRWEEAIATLRPILLKHPEPYQTLASTDPDLAALRSDQRFQALLKSSLDPDRM